MKMKKLSVSLIIASAEAKIFPYSKNYEFLTVHPFSPNTSKNYEMAVTFTVSQEEKDTEMMFKVLASVYPAADFVNG